MTSIEHFFDKVLAPSWPALQQTLRHQIDDIAATFLHAGVDGVLRGLPRGLRRQPPMLEVDTWTTGHPSPAQDIEIGGHGLVLVPSPFAGPHPPCSSNPASPP
jgi:hypothetical protein